MVHREVKCYKNYFKMKKRRLFGFPYLLMTSSLPIPSWQLIHPSHLFQSTQIILDVLSHSLKQSLTVLVVVVVADDFFVQ